MWLQCKKDDIQLTMKSNNNQINKQNRIYGNQLTQIQSNKIRKKKMCKMCECRRYRLISLISKSIEAIKLFTNAVRLVVFMNTQKCELGCSTNYNELLCKISIFFFDIYWNKYDWRLVRCIRFSTTSYHPTLSEKYVFLFHVLFSIFFSFFLFSRFSFTRYSHIFIHI